MKRECRQSLVIAALFMAIGLCCPSAWAGGILMYDIGTLDTALSAAGWAARAQDASTVFKNPAGMSLLEKSQVQMGAQLTSKKRENGFLCVKSLVNTEFRYKR